MRLGLRAQIALTLFTVAVMTVGLLAYSDLDLIERTVFDQQVFASQRLTAAAAVGLAAELERTEGGLQANLDYAESQLRALLEDGRVLRADLIDPDGGRLLSLSSRVELDDPNIVAGSEQSQLISVSGLPDVVLLLVHRDIETSLPQATIGDGSGQGGRPRASFGTLLLVHQLANTRDLVGTARLLFVMYGALGALLLGIGGYLLLTRVIVAPIRRIRLAAERVAEGHHASRVNLGSRNEIGDLAHSLNHMLDRLAENQTRLADQVDALENARREVERAQAAMIRGEKLASVGQLAAGVAHEVGNPLSALLGFVEILRDEPELPEEERSDILGRFERELLRIHSIIRELLDYSRSGPQQGIEAEHRTADLSEILYHARKLVESQPRFKRIQLEWAIDDDLPLLQTDADPVLQVMVNLLMNAADASDGKGRIVVEAKTQGRGAAVSITDSGPGITADALAHIFEPFFTTKGPGRGTGLGLAICDMIVSSINGRIEVDAGGAGAGATFSVWIPAISEKPSGELN